MKTKSQTNQTAPWQRLLDYKNQRSEQVKINPRLSNRPPQRFQAKTRPGAK